jgi:hypothetical protein
MKIALTVLVTSAVCFGLTATTGLASHSRSYDRSTIYPTLDLACDLGSSPYGRPALYCFTLSGPLATTHVTCTKRKVYVTFGAAKLLYAVNRK